MDKAQIKKYGTMVLVSVITSAIMVRLAKKNATVAKVMNG